MTAIDETEDVDLAAPETRAAGRWNSAGVPTERSRDFGAAMRRLARLLGADVPVLVVVLVLAVTATVCNVFGPRFLGHGTDIPI